MLSLSVGLWLGGRGVSGGVVLPPSGGVITGPSNFADPQFNDDRDRAYFTVDKGAVRVFAILHNASDPQPDLTPAGFVGTFSQAEDHPVTAGANLPNFPTLTDDTTDRVSFGILMSDGSVQGPVTFANTWPQIIELTELAEGGQNNYNGNPFAMTEFTLSEPRTVVVSMGGRGDGFGQLTSIAFTGPNGEDESIAVDAMATQEGSVDSGVTLAVGTLPAGTYNTIDPVGNTSSVTGFNFNVQGVNGLAEVVGSPQVRDDTLGAGERYTSNVPNVAIGNAVIAAIGTRPGQGDGVERYSPVGGVEAYDSGTPGSGQSSNTGSLYVVKYEASVASSNHEIGGINDGTQQGGSASVTVHIRKI